MSTRILLNGDGIRRRNRHGYPAGQRHRGAGQNAVIRLSLRRGGIATALQRRLPSPPDERYVKYSSDYQRAEAAEA
jgi:hypothetical protein